MTGMQTTLLVKQKTEISELVASPDKISAMIAYKNNKDFYIVIQYVNTSCNIILNVIFFPKFLTVVLLYLL